MAGTGLSEVPGDLPVDVAGVVLAAGAGDRLRPLTTLRPKALCPVGDAALVDLALDRLRPVATGLAVNVHHGRDQMQAHLAERAHVSVEEPEVLGTAGALGALRDWIDGRPVLVTNADAWLADPDLARVDLAAFVAGWDGERVRLLTVLDPARGDFGDQRYAGVALHPWPLVAAMGAEPSGLYEVCWRQEATAGRLDLVTHRGPFVDCGTPRDYLAANLAASGGASVVGHGAAVAGRLVRSVVWPGVEVRTGEVLVDAIRADDRITVLVR